MRYNILVKVISQQTTECLSMDATEFTENFRELSEVL